MKQIKNLSIALMLVASSAFAQLNATSEYIITNDYPIDNINGRLWVGNFGTNGGSLLDQTEVQSADWSTLITKFRPNTSFGITGGLLDGLTNGERQGAFSVGTAINYGDEGGPQGYTPDTATQFAGQDLYFFAINNGASVWDSANLGGEYRALLIKMNTGFGDGDPATGLLAYDISGGVNTVIIGTGGSDFVATAAVPEPAIGSLLLLGGVAVLAARRRKI